MKKQIVKWQRVILIIQALIVLTAAIIILGSLQGDEPKLIELYHSNIRNTIYITSFFYFCITLIFYFNLPGHVRNTMKDIITILRDWKNDKYAIEIDMEEKKLSYDREVYDVIVQMVETREMIQTHRVKRKQKILEHKNRILALLRLIKEGGLIIDTEGKIVFANDVILEAFPQLEENENLLNKTYPAEIENNLKKLAQISFEKEKRQDPLQCFIPSMKRHLTIDSAFVRDQEGLITGLVLIVHNLEKRKSERKQEKEADRSANAD